MNKKTKLLLAVLSASCITAGAIGFAGCGQTPSAQDDFHKAYALYTAYAESQGDIPASYEEWLAAIKGEKGDKGDPGEKGDKGDKGDAGKGIVSVSLSSDGMSLIVNYSDGSSETIPLIPEDTHKYGDKIVIVSEPTADKMGLGYKECKEDGCSNVEYVQLHKLGTEKVTERGIYTFSVNVSEDDNGLFSAEPLEIPVENIIGGVHKYSIKVSDANAKLSVEGDEENASQSLSFVLGSEESETVSLSLDAMAIGVPCNYVVRIEVEESYIDEGESADNPISIQLNQLSDVTYARSGEWVYFSYEGNSTYDSFWDMSDTFKPASGIFKFGKNVEMEIVGAVTIDEDTWGYVYTEDVQKITSGESVEFPSGYHKVIIRAKASDGVIFFDSAYGLGTSAAAPIVIESDQYETGKMEGYGNYKYFKFVAPESGKYLLFNGQAYTWNNDYGLSSDDHPVIDSEGNNYYNRYTEIELEKGEEFAFHVGETFDVAILSYDANKIAGVDYLSPIEISGNGSKIMSEGKGSRYFKYTAEKSGRLSVSGDKNSEFSVSLSTDFIIGDSLGENPFVKAGDVVYVQVDTTASPYALNFSVTEVSACDNVIVIKDQNGNPVIDATVKLGDDLASGKTDADGKVTLNYIPQDKIAISISFADDNYRLNSEIEEKDGYVIVLPSDGSKDNGGEYSFAVDKISDHAITVQCGESKLSNVKVKVLDAGEEVIAEGVSDSEGKLSLSFFPGNYSVVLEGLDAETYYFGGMEIDRNASEIAIEVSSLVSYSVTVKAPEGDSAFDFNGMQVDFSANGSVIKSASVNSNGTVQVKLPDLDYVASVSGVEGCVGSVSIAQGTHSAEIQLIKYDAMLQGGGKASKAVSIDLGATMITNVGYVKYTSSESATYVFSMIYNYFRNVQVNNRGLTVTASGVYNADLVANGVAGALDSYQVNESSLVISFELTLDENEYVSFRNAQAEEIVIISKKVGNEENPNPGPNPGGDEQNPSVNNKLNMDKNDIVLSSSDECYSGKKLSFVADEDGFYEISCDDESGQICDVETLVPLVAPSDGVNSYKFYLTAGSSIEFLFVATDMDATDARYSVFIAKSEGDSENSTVLVWGDNIVHATYDGVEYTFMAEESGSYKISWDSSNSNAYPMEGDWSTCLENGKIFNLEAGKSIKFVFATLDGDDTYVVTISNPMEK